MNKSSDSQRKTPKQERSKAIVESIFEATVRILPKIGTQNLTTKKIAEFAGISIGSLYQYFPNKDSVLSSLMDLMTKAHGSAIQKRIEEIDGKTMKEATDIMIDMGLDTFLTEKEKVAEIFRKAPELGKIPSLLELRRTVVERLAEEMKKHNPGHPHEDYVRVSFVAVNSTMGIVQTMLYDETQTYTREELSKEIKIMLNSYFEKRALA